MNRGEDDRSRRRKRKQKGRGRRRIREEKTKTSRRSGGETRRKGKNRRKPGSSREEKTGLFEGAGRGHGQEKEANYLYNSIVSAKVSLMLPERLERGALCPQYLE